MSGIEAVKVIVDAEKEAARILAEAQSKASQIRKSIDSRIQEERQRTLDGAKKEASAIVQHAEDEGKVEAANVTKDSGKNVQELVTKASAHKNAAVDKLVNVILQENK
jgi:vacuolar-type H+-ATPase subunit H